MNKQQNNGWISASGGWACALIILIDNMFEKPDLVTSITSILVSICFAIAVCECFKK